MGNLQNSYKRQGLVERGKTQFRTHLGLIERWQDSETHPLLQRACRDLQGCVERDARGRRGRARRRAKFERVGRAAKLPGSPIDCLVDVGQWSGLVGARKSIASASSLSCLHGAAAG